MEKTNRPNLFLVGSPKCGTTYLWSKLKEHPKIFSPKFPEKEINFFSYNNLKNDSYYKFYGISKLNDYLNLFKNSTNLALLCSPKLLKMLKGSGTVVRG